MWALIVSCARLTCQQLTAWGNVLTTLPWIACENPPTPVIVACRLHLHNVRSQRQTQWSLIVTCGVCFVTFVIAAHYTPPPAVVHSVLFSHRQAYRYVRISEGEMKGLRWLHLQPSQGAVRDNIHTDITIRGSDAWKTGRNKSPQQMLHILTMDRLVARSLNRVQMKRIAGEKPNVAMKVQEVVKSCWNGKCAERLFCWSFCPAQWSESDSKPYWLFHFKFKIKNEKDLCILFVNSTSSLFLFWDVRLVDCFI